MRAVVTTDAREPVLEDAAGEELVCHLPNDGTPRAVLAREALAVHRPQAVEMILLPMPVAGPVVGAAVREMIVSRGVDYFPGHKPTAVDPIDRTIRFESGDITPYDLLVYIPPHAAPAFVVDAGLAPAGGWVKVDRKTLATSAERVWAVGDVTAIPLANGKFLPKAGVFAKGQADVVARNIAALVRGTTPWRPFAGGGAPRDGGCIRTRSAS